MKTQTLKNALKTGLAASAIILSTIIGSAPKAEAQAPVKNIVLVHGAFADGSGYKGVYDILTKKGYNVTVVQNPLTSLKDDVDATNRAIDGRASRIDDGGRCDSRRGTAAKPASL